MLGDGPPKNLIRIPCGRHVDSQPVQFDEDWPGLFLRGDRCIGYATAVEKVLRSVQLDHYTMSELELLLHDLQSPLI